MSNAAIKKSVEDLLALSPEGLKKKLPGTLEEVRSYGIGKLLQEDPDFLARLLTKLKEVDTARLFNELPGISDRLMDLLWEGVGERAGQLKDMKALLEKAERDMHVNIEAADSPFRGHFIVEKGKIKGSSGLLHFKDEDFRFMGPTQVLIELLTGDLALGFSNLRLQTAGHSGWVSRVGPVVRDIAKLLKGGQEAAKLGSGI